MGNILVPLYNFNSPYTKTGKQANYERDNADGSHDNAHIDIND